MLPFNRSWIHQLDRGRVTVRRSSGTITPYLVAQRCRATLKGGTYGLFCRPKVPCDTQRRHLRGLFVAREHSDKLSREQNAPFRSRERLGRLSVSRTRYFAHETTSEDPPVSRTRRLAHETSLADLFVSRTRRSAHETVARDTRGNRGAFSASYGNSTGALRALLDAAEVRPEPMGLVIGLSAFRNRHLDG